MEKCFQLYLELTNRCNLKCIHCYLGSNTQNIRDIPIENAKKAIEEFAKIEGKYVTLSGGETTLYHEWPILANFLKNLDLETTIMTNGLNLKKYIGAFKDLKVKIGISLDSSKKDTFQKIRRGANYDRIIQNLSLLKKEGLSNSVIICYTPMKLNFKDLPGIFQLMGEFNIPSIYISILETRGRVVDNIGELPLYDKEKSYFLNQLYFLYSRYKNTYRICISNFRGFMERLIDPGYGVSDFFDRTMRIDASGNVYLTAYLDDDEFLLGNIKESSLDELWNTEKVEKIFFNVKNQVKERCINCKWYSICQGGSAMLSYQKHKTFSMPDDWCNAKKDFLEKYHIAMS